MSTVPEARPHIAILGAGPTGLEAALAAAAGGYPFTLYEAAPQAAGNVRGWGHVRLFTPWSMNVSPRVRAALAAAGYAAPDGEDCPTGTELAERLLQPVAALPAVAAGLRLGTRVVAVGREGLLKHEEIASAARGATPFRLLLAGRDGGEWVERADLVIDTTGTYGQPNSLGDGGIPAPGELPLAPAIRRSIPDLAREAHDWAGRTILLAGSGHSAQTAARDLAELARVAPGTRVVWALRRREPEWGSPAGDPLAERARLAATAAELTAGASPAVQARRGVAVEALAPAAEGRVLVRLRNGGGESVIVDRVLSLTGSIGDHSLYRQLQVHECYATAAPMKLSAALLGAAGGDCLSQTSHGVEVLTNPEPGFFILGAKSYGRNNTFLMR
ncbi:MAG TPA: flavoprotein, partial [Thermoanaerobaculia bacterium]|nr:flavoprotein [Thermoanaerobaculia bacterium]